MQSSNGVCAIHKMFSFLAAAFDFILYRPLFNFLILIYNFLPGKDFGLAIILLTIFVKLVLYPLSHKTLHSQKALLVMQPKIKEIQKKYKNDKEKQARETLELYRRENINPFSGFFLIIIQLPLLIALYQVFSYGLRLGELDKLYSFITNPVDINPLFLGFMNLSQPSLILAAAAAIVQFFQTKMLQPFSPNIQSGKHDINAMVQKQMMYFLPLLTFIILYKLPSALGLYWTVSGLFAIVQQYIFFRKSTYNYEGK